MNISGGWNGSCEDWLHGDEDLIDADEYAPLEPYEIAEALADIKRKTEQEQEQ